MSVISCLLRRSQLFGGGSRDRWWSGGGDPVLLVSESGGGGNICGVLLSLALSLSGVLSTVSSFTILSSSDEDSESRLSLSGLLAITEVLFDGIGNEGLCLFCIA